MRKISIISGIVILLAAAVYLGIKYFPAKSKQPVIQIFSTKQNPAFKAVPQKSPLLIEIKDQEGFFNALKGENPILAELKGIPEFKELYSDISGFRDFVSTRSGIGKLLKGKSVIVSVNPSGKNQFSNLFLAQMNDKDESSSACRTVSSELGPEYSVIQRNYDNTIIYNAKSGTQNFYFACSDDIFMVCKDFILIEEAIRHTQSINLLSNSEFTEVYKTIEETALANIFVNHRTISQVIGKFVSPEIRKTIGQISSYSSWSELDLSLQPSTLELNGFSVTRDSTDNYLNVFRGQEAEKLTIDQAIPANASYFVTLNLKNPSAYISQYETYLRAKGNYYPREVDLAEFQKKTKTDAVRLIKDVAGNQFAAVFTNINKSNPTQNRFFVAQLLNESDAREKFQKAVTEYEKSSIADRTDLRTEYPAGGKKSIEIYRLPIANMAESLFGKAFSGINAEYFTLYRKYLICGDNLPGLKSYLQSLISEKTMANDSIYKATLKNGQEKPNFFLFARVPKVFRLKDALLKPEMSAALSEDEDVIRKFSIFSWQFSVANKMIKNRISLKYDPLAKEEPQAVWQLKLDGPVMRTPKLVLNHKDLPNREVIVYDNQNHVSLITKEGVALWTINIPDPIVSDIYQLDLYGNKRFQYLFNTKTQLYVIDRLGNKVGKFPVTLKSIASNGVSIAEYGKNKEFRFFVAGEDKQIYAFDRDGRLVPKWGFKGSESLVKDPVQHVEIDDKDYLVFSDKRNVYFLDRQGKSRGIQSEPFDRSSNPLYFRNNGKPVLITTDSSGKIHILDFTGQQEIKEVGKFGPGHRFAAEDIDGNGSLEYLFAEGKKLTVFAPDGKKLFERTFPDDISQTPFICQMGTGVVKIGVVVKGANKIYLLDKNGSITRGFPLDGNTSFVLGKFNDANNWYNLIVGSEGNTLVNYRIE